MSRGAISVLTAAGLGLAGAAAILGTLVQAPPGPSGRPRPTITCVGPPPTPLAATRLASSEAVEDIGAAPSEVKAPFAIAVRICGRVEDDLGQPLEGARVWGPVTETRFRRGGYPIFQPIWTAETDSDGRFDVTVDSADFELSRGPPAKASQVGYAATESESASPWPGDSAEARDHPGLVLVLRRMARIEGVVRDRAGCPLPGARFLVTYKGDQLGGAGLGRTDREGRFLWWLDADALSEARVRAEALGAEGEEVVLRGPFERGASLAVDLWVDPRASDRRPDPGPWVLAGQIRDPHGNPIGGAACAGGLVTTDASAGWSGAAREDGRFEVLLEGTLEEGDSVYFGAPGFQDRRWQLESGILRALRNEGRVEGLEVVLQPAGNPVGD